MITRRLPRPVLRGAAAFVTVLLTGLLTGCTSVEDSAPEPAPAKASSTAPAKPSVSYSGKTKIITLGDVEVRATPHESGVDVACIVTNMTGEDVNIDVEVSVGNGQKRVDSYDFEFYQVPVGDQAEQTRVLATSYARDLPDDPKVSIDSVRYH